MRFLPPSAERLWIPGSGKTPGRAFGLTGGGGPATRLADALEGNSEALRNLLDGKATLSQDEAKYLVEHMVDQWSAKGTLSAELGEFIQAITGDKALSQRVGAILAGLSADAIAENRNDADTNTLAVAAVGAMGGDEAALHSMIVRLGPKARDFGAALATVPDFAPEADAERADGLNALRAEAAAALAQALTAVNGGPAKDAEAFVDGVVYNASKNTYRKVWYNEGGISADLGPSPAAEPMTFALARLIRPDNPDSEKSRLWGLVTQGAGYTLLTASSVEGRRAALDILKAYPQMTAASLMEGWQAPVAGQAFLMPSADAILRANGGHAVEYNIDELDRMAGMYYANSNQAIGSAIQQAYRDMGGSEQLVRVAVLPTLLGTEDGPVQLPLLRVEYGGQSRFVDTYGHRYDSLDAWVHSTPLPKGMLTYPKDGELHYTIGGTPALASSPTPAAGTVRQVEEVTDLVAYGAALTPVPYVRVAAGLYIAGRSLQDLHDMEQRHEDVGVWDVVADVFGTFGGLFNAGRIGFTSRLLKAGRPLTAAEGYAYALLNSASAQANAVAWLATTAKAAQNYDKMSQADVLKAILAMAFWSRAAASSVRGSV
jgi:hypothetical protein